MTKNINKDHIDKVFKRKNESLERKVKYLEKWNSLVLQVYSTIDGMYKNSPGRSLSFLGYDAYPSFDMRFTTDDPFPPTFILTGVSFYAKNNKVKQEYIVRVDAERIKNEKETKYRVLTYRYDSISCILNCKTINPNRYIDLVNEDSINQIINRLNKKKKLGSYKYHEPRTINRFAIEFNINMDYDPDGNLLQQ